LSVTLKPGQEIMYYDGLPVSSTTNTSSLPVTASTIKIGGTQFGSYHYPWIGDIDEVSIYNRALTGAEIKKLAQISALPPAPKLIISPNSTSLVPAQTYDLVFIIQNYDAAQPVISKQITLDGVDRTADFLTGATEGTILKGVYTLTGSPVLAKGKHTLTATFTLQSGTVLTATETYTILAP